MSEEDPTYDRDQVLSAIDQAIPTESGPPAEAYAAPEPLPDPEPMPEPLPAAELMPQSEELPAPELVPTPEPPPVASRPLSSRAMPAPLSPWMRHRHEVAGLVTAFVAIVWLAVGVGMGAWMPAMMGMVFAGGAACIKAYAPPV